jgi:hypothetical protein
MTLTKLIVAQRLIVFTATIVGLWVATEWTGAKLTYPQLIEQDHGVAGHEQRSRAGVINRPSAPLAGESVDRAADHHFCRLPDGELDEAAT